MDKPDNIVAIILGAGLSMRMGHQKLLLPWKNTTVLGNIVSVLSSNQIKDIIVVIQPDHDHLQDYIIQLSNKFPVRFTMNELFRSDDMVTSIQYGLKAIRNSPAAALVVLGDQPQIKPDTINQIIHIHKKSKSSILIPSFSMRRGHPWLIPFHLIPQFMKLQYPLTPRDFLEQHKNEIKYVIVDNDSILTDIDTPDEYQTSIQTAD